MPGGMEVLGCMEVEEWGYRGRVLGDLFLLDISISPWYASDYTPSCVS